jgi:hypothetical protein
MYRVRACPPVLSMRPRTLKFDEENSTYAGLAQENGFSPSFLLRLVKSAAKLAVHLLEKRVINMI